MKSLRKTKFLILAPLLLAAGLLCPSNLLAQEPPSAPVPKVPQDAPPPSQTNAQDTQIPASQQNPSDSQTTLKFSVNYVFLPVTVKDSEGHLVADLTRSEFRVFDDNVEQRLEFFSAEAFPLSVVVLLSPASPPFSAVSAAMTKLSSAASI